MRVSIAMLAALVCSLAGLFLAENSQQAAAALIVSNIWLVAAFLSGGKQ